MSNITEEMFWRLSQQATAEAAGAAPASSQSTPASPTDQSETSPAGRTAAALAAAARATEQKELVAAARLLVQEETGQELDPAHWDDEEVLRLAGISQSPADVAAREKRERDDAILSDSAKYAAYVAEQDRADFHRRYWTISRSQREEEAARLGIDLSTYQPSSRVGSDY